MKKILLVFVLMAMTAVVQQSYGQACAPGFIKRWTGAGGGGDQGVGQAGSSGTNLFVINGNILDWQEHITGALNPVYAGGSPPTYQPDPFSAPVSAPNVQQDGLKTGTGPNYDRDRPAQDFRDLRYFAFTYDRANTYFFMRRPGNNSSQVTFFYLVDINLDGFMRDFEPIIKVVYNGATASIEMGYYTENTSLINNGTSAPGSWILNKGNSMVATVARAGGANTSEWTVGASDGWSMQGSYNTAASGQLPALGVISGINETFSASAVTDGPNTGYAVEFAVPWNYLRLYDGAGAAPVPYDATYNPMTYQRVFTWHVSVNNGNSSDLNTAEDNAGGCCSGLAFSGTANTDKTAETVLANGDPKSQYRVKLTYTDVTGFPTNVTMSQVSFNNIVQFGVNPPDPTTYTVKVYPGDGAGEPVGPGNTFIYSSGTNPPYNYTGTDVTVLAPALGTAKFVVDIDFGASYRTKSVIANFLTDNAFNVTTIKCSNQSTSGDDVPVGVTTTLPVIFQSFTASRYNSNVMLKWTTSLEQNSSGFAVERNTNGAWQEIAFVASQASGGNSSDLLSYQYIDANDTKGISQYRLRQVDLDNNSRYSEIRTVRGEAQVGKIIVYPNPTIDGKVSVSFEDAALVRDVSLMDMSGRVLKQWKALTNKNITIENLTPGMYTLRVIVPETGEQVVEKIVVNKR